jgi:hypothetical protein
MENIKLYCMVVVELFQVIQDTDQWRAAVNVVIMNFRVPWPAERLSACQGLSSMELDDCHHFLDFTNET